MDIRWFESSIGIFWATSSDIDQETEDARHMSEHSRAGRGHCDKTKYLGERLQ